jgi:hypothetical protein
MGDDVFRQQDQDISGRILHVPNGTADAYQADWHWFPFFEMIVEMGHVYGDVNGDDEVNIADVNVVIDVVLGGDNAAADVNGDGEVNIADVNTTINCILGSGNLLDDYMSDVNRDGEVNIADINVIIDIILSGSWN